MPRPDGRLWPHERAELNVKRRLYNEAVDKTKLHPESARMTDAAKEKAFAALMLTATKYAGCRYR